ncbi:MAG: CHAT domain-containing protein [Bacteroidia bacterium]|nr:CHAT domain-containing protein [Bacteroidia bacterium]
MKKLFKIPILICVICVISLISGSDSFSQSWQELDSNRNAYMERQSYDTALIYAEKALQEAKETVGENDTLYANMLTWIFEVNYYAGNYEKAIEYGEKEKEIRKQLLGEKNLTYANSLDNLGVLYGIMSNYSKAELLMIEAKKIRKEILGNIHSDYAASLHNMSSLYEAMGNYSKAEQLIIEAKEIDKNILGNKHPVYATDLNNLAALYKTIGNYSKSEQLFFEVKDIWKEVLGDKHPLYATSLNNLAVLFEDMGNYSKAEPLYIEAKNIRKEVLGEKHPDYAISLNNLAVLYQTLHNYSKAEPLYIESMEIKKETFGEKHPNYAMSLNNLAVLYYKMGKYAAAEPLYLEAMKIRKEVLGEKHPDYAQSLNNLAALYQAMGNSASSEKDMADKYAAAELLYLESLNIRKEVLGEKHPDYATSLIDLAILYKETSNYSKAEQLFIKGIEVILYNIFQNFSFLSEDEKELYFKTLSGDFEEFYYFALKRKLENPAIVNYVYNNTVMNKGLLLKSSTAMRTAILSSGDTSLINKYETWISLKTEISQLYSTEISKRKKNPEELERQANAIEKDLVRGSQVFSDFEKVQNINWESVKNSLKPSEAAIEFIRFKSGSKQRQEAVAGGSQQSAVGSQDTVVYCALIITPQNQQPEMLQLFDEKQMLEILNTASGNNYNQVNSIYGTNEKINDALYKLIWQPIEKYLEGVKTVYYSPDGLLHKVSFAALCKGKNLYLCDNYNLQQVSSTGKVAMPTRKVISAGGTTVNISEHPETSDLAGRFTTCIFGGIEYSTDTTTNKLWPYLSGTLTEAEGIKNKFESRKVPVALYPGKNATEESFKQLFGSNQTLSVPNNSGADRPCTDSLRLSQDNRTPAILHIATHGFFYPDPEEKQQEQEQKQEVSETMLTFRGGTTGFGLWQFVKNKNPLMRSGLVLAGANNVWNQRFVGESEDGILTAQEVTQLDMRKTQLVVLSACETGLGDIRGSEGVYGLQRAFKMAGVKYIIMSLWQVPDKETKEFMVTFYTKLLKQKDVRKAFNKTQAEMRKKYDPYYWAAFVLIE